MSWTPSWLRLFPTSCMNLTSSRSSRCGSSSQHAPAAPAPRRVFTPLSLPGGEGGRPRRAAGLALHGWRRHGALHQRRLWPAVAMGALLSLGLFRRQAIPEQASTSCTGPLGSAGHVRGPGTTRRERVAASERSCERRGEPPWRFSASAAANVSSLQEELVSKVEKMRQAILEGINLSRPPPPPPPLPPPAFLPPTMVPPFYPMPPLYPPRPMGGMPPHHHPHHPHHPAQHRPRAFPGLSTLGLSFGILGPPVKARSAR